MSGHNPETLFSFELLVEYIRLERRCQVSTELALGVRLLDFPTLLIYQPQKSSGSVNPPEQRENDKLGECAFNRGKSCFFKMDLSSLHADLCNTPLYAMVLDVSEETPRLVGSSLISMSKAMDRIRHDVTQRGFSSPSSHRERGLVGISNLAGERIGTLSLSYKLVCLGASLLPHITEKRGSESVTGGQQQQQQQQQQHVKEKNKSTESLPPGHSPTVDKSDFDIQTDGRAESKILLNDNKRGDVESQTANNSEEDSTVFCPPHLYYCNTAQERSSSVEEDLNSGAFAFEDSCSGDEEDKKEGNGSSSPGVHQKVAHAPKMSSGQETSGVTSDVLREALRQLPLLNALVTELSQLSGHGAHQSLSVGPTQAWVNGAASTEPAATGNATRQAQAHTLRKTRPQAGADCKYLQPPRNCSTPIFNPASVKMKDNQEGTLNGNKSHSKSQRRKLVYGTTKTFNLRLKQISPLRVKRRECMETMQNETQPRASKGKTKSSRKAVKSGKRKSALNQSPDFSENIETVVQSVTVDAAPQGALTLKQKTPDRRTHEGPGKVSQRHLKCIHIPRADGDIVPRSKDTNEHHSKSDQSESESDGRGHKIESSQSGRRSSSKSSFSESSAGRDAEADYADDFDSLESSGACSPDPPCSPELSRAETWKSSVRPDLYDNLNPRSEVIQRRAAPLPVPVKAPGSPLRALMGTHIIRPVAVSFSSDDDEDGPTSAQTACSRKQTTSSKKGEQSSRAESSAPSRGQRSASTEDSNAVQGLSVESVSSFEAQEGEELKDELGSLDFRKEYQHISELVANKLPGYTM
ncbi:microtubule-associated protein 10 [Odontesthes bonariensis]|uniref:microtubule-associated protein 10 n=1 Tax=Odontesthes bonariensis TaxID=219752 RepID=UPI003F58F505